MKVKLIAGGLVAVVVALAALGYARASSGDNDRSTRANLHFLLREEIIPLDEGEPGPSDHERLIFRGKLLDPETKRLRGTELGVCITADVERQSRLVCQMVFTPAATNSLATADQITMQTIFDDVQTSRPQRSAITGGTGRYAGVGGEIVARPASDDLIDVTFRFHG